MILDVIIKATTQRLQLRKEMVPLEKLLELIYEGNTVRSFHGRLAFAFEKALKKSEMSFICEIKKASPSKGILVELFPFLEIAKEYQKAGADAISVLTEPEFFQGSIEYLSEISKQSNIPLLQKDFFVDEYQIYEAKAYGADAILLIAGVLDTQTLKKYLCLCNELGLSALVETHSVEEIESAVAAGARVIGVNNRDLKTFTVDLELSIQLRTQVPRNITFVAESGIWSRTDVLLLMEAGVDGVLIGESLMKAPDKKHRLQELKGIVI